MTRRGCFALFAGVIFAPRSSLTSTPNRADGLFGHAIPESLDIPFALKLRRLRHLNRITAFSTAEEMEAAGCSFHNLRKTQ